MQDPQSANSDHLDESDPAVQRQLTRLHELTVWGRWIVIGVLWVCLVPPSLWVLRHEMVLWREYFTWTAVRFGLAYHPVAAIALSLCIGATTTTLIWQSRNILFGISKRQRRRLQKLLLEINQQGQRHPLWRWLYK